MRTKVLVVDDDHASASTLSKLFGRIDCEAVICADPRGLVASAIASEADLVCLDISMPSLDGYEVLALLRSHEHSRRMPPVPAIAVTGFTMNSARAAALSAGFVAHIRKPTLLHELASAVDRAMALRGAFGPAGDGKEFAELGARVRGMSEDGRQRLASTAGLAIAVEQQGVRLLERSLLDYYDRQIDQSRRVIQRLAELGRTLSASRLYACCGDWAECSDDDPASFELHAVRARAELDRVVCALRGAALH